MKAVNYVLCCQVLLLDCTSRKWYECKYDKHIWGEQHRSHKNSLTEMEMFPFSLNFDYQVNWSCQNNNFQCSQGWQFWQILVQPVMKISTKHHFQCWQLWKVRTLKLHGFNKNIERHTAHTIVSWPNPKQWVIVHTSDLMMIMFWLH